jgi:dTDP-4-amino-4,6-dideoxygalactose transaminase
MTSLHAHHRHVPTGGALALFSGRRVSYSFNTRVAIRKACDILGLRPGDEVLAPAFNCGSELDPLLDAGLAVRLYGVDRQAMVEPEAIARLIGPRTRAVYLTHYFGALHSLPRPPSGPCATRMGCGLSRIAR